jgi:hypothetical protein
MFRLIFALSFLLTSAELVCAQAPGINTTVQLPTVRNFSINTVVSVPDGGTMYLGGSPSGSQFSSRRPGVRSSSRSIGGPGISVSATLIIGSEVDAKLDRRSRIALARKARPKIHGTEQEKAKASFLAKHLGRGWK